MASVQKARTARAAARSDRADVYESVRSIRQAECIARVLGACRAFRQAHAFGFMPLPELFRAVRTPRADESPGVLSIGEFHDALRLAVSHRHIRLHPFTGAAYQLQDEQYALVSGQEIKFYAEPLAGGAI